MLMLMKMWVLLILCVVTGVLSLPAAPISSGFSVVSPDRPAIWFNRSGDKVSQDLSWDGAKRELVLYVSYNTIQNLSERDQWYYDNFKLSFPNVRLNEATDRLYFIDKHSRQIALGHLEDGIFGRKVVLDDGIHLDVNRRDDAVHATITSAGGPARKPISR